MKARHIIVLLLLVMACLAGAIYAASSVNRQVHTGGGFGQRPASELTDPERFYVVDVDMGDGTVAKCIVYDSPGYGEGFECPGDAK